MCAISNNDAHARPNTGYFRPALSVPRHREALTGTARCRAAATLGVGSYHRQVTQRPRLLLVDGHSLAYRAFYALPVENFSTSTGQPTNAVYGFTSMLINTLRDERPTHVAVAFDVSRQTFRSERFAEYKANRAKSPEGFAGQVDLIRQVLDAMGIVSIAEAGYEADDVIATLATSTAGSQSDAADAKAPATSSHEPSADSAANPTEGAGAADVLIVTGDRDVLQLVDERTTVLYPRRGVSDLDRFDPAAVIEKYGLTPAQYPDFAALRGDPSDNLPGIPGVGEKTAAKWIREYGGLRELLDRVESVPGKVGQALRDHREQVAVNRELTELIRDVPLHVQFADLQLPRFDADRINEVFDALQFRVLRERIFDYLGDYFGEAGGNQVGAATQPGADADFSQQYAWLDKPGALTDWLAAHANAGTPTAIAVEGSWGRGTGRCWAIALATADASDAAWFDPTAMDPLDEAAWASWLADAASPKAMHSAKGPLLAFAERGWALAGLAADTEVAAYVLLPGRRSSDLAELATTFLGKSLPGPESEDGQLSLVTTDEDAGRGRLAAQARAIAALAIELDQQATSRNAASLLRDVELPLVGLLARMERAGICVDVPYLRSLAADYAREMATAEESAHELAGQPFNLGSPKQLQEILFGQRGLPKTKKIKTGYTTDADALAWLTSVSDDPLPAVLLRWRDVSKLRQTVAGLIPLADAQHRVHTTLQQTITTTGRLSSTDPNLQNIPIRTAEGRRIRRGFVVGPDYETLLTADYSQIEMRIMAHLSADAGLIVAFRSGEDLHTTVAAHVFGVEPGSVDPEQRRRIKAMSYGLAYGLSAFGLSQQLGISTEEARGLMEEYFRRFGGVRDYLEDVVHRARATGFTETLLGRRRYLPDLTSDNRQRREMAERMALNAPIQGSAADIVKVAMLRVDAALLAAGMRTRLLLQLHDELILEVARGETDAATKIVVDEMSSAIELSVPLDVSTGIGRTWHEAAH